MGDRRRLMSYFGILLICCKKHPGFLIPVKDIAENMPGATSGFRAVDIVSEDKRTDAFFSTPHDADLGSLFDCMNRVATGVGKPLAFDVCARNKQEENLTSRAGF